MTSKLTREELLNIIETDHVQCGEASALARMALAAMDSEPVAVIDQANLDYLRSGADADVWPPEREEMGDVLLYRHAQPAPVVLDEIISELEQVRDWILNTLPVPTPPTIPNARRLTNVINACRAAMLQENAKSAGESNNCRSRENVQDLLAGNCRENGNSSTNNCREIAETSTNRSREHFISLCNEFWNWSEMDLVCADEKGYEPTMEWNGTKFTHRVTQALWRMYQAAPGNSPVIPDGYVMVPKEPTQEMFIGGGQAIVAAEMVGEYHTDTAKKVWGAMLAAAPQEVKGE